MYYNKTVYFKFIAFLNRRVSSPVYDWLVLTCVDEPARRPFTELFGLVGKRDLYNPRKLSSRGLNTNGMWRNKLKRHQNKSVQAPMNNKIDNYGNKWNSISINFGHIKSSIRYWKYVINLALFAKLAEFSFRLRFTFTHNCFKQSFNAAVLLIVECYTAYELVMRIWTSYWNWLFWSGDLRVH